MLYYLSYLKLGSTFAKEVPQVPLNRRRKSTFGWSIYPVLLNNCGCTLCMGQQALDSWATSDWGAITGNPVKFLLAFVSMSINGVYMMQHYMWYADRIAAMAREQQELAPLLPTTKAPPTLNALHAHRRPAGWVALHGHHGADEYAVDKVFWDAAAELVRV